MRTSVAIMLVLRLHCNYAGGTLSIAVMLVDISFAIMHVTVSAAII